MYLTIFFIIFNTLFKFKRFAISFKINYISDIRLIRQYRSNHHMSSQIFSEWWFTHRLFKAIFNCIYWGNINFFFFKNFCYSVHTLTVFSKVKNMTNNISSFFINNPTFFVNFIIFVAIRRMSYCVSLILSADRIFRLISFAYHSFIMFLNGVKSSLPLSLSTPSFTAINRTSCIGKIVSVSYPTSI